MLPEASARRSSGSVQAELEGNGGGHRGQVGDEEKNSTECKGLLQGTRTSPRPHRVHAAAFRWHLVGNQ